MSDLSGMDAFIEVLDQLGQSQKRERDSESERANQQARADGLARDIKQVRCQNEALVREVGEYSVEVLKLRKENAALTFVGTNGEPPSAAVQPVPPVVLPTLDEVRSNAQQGEDLATDAPKRATEILF